LDRLRRRVADAAIELLLNANSALAGCPTSATAFAFPAAEFAGDHFGRHILDDVRREESFYFREYTRHHRGIVHTATDTTLMNRNVGISHVCSIFWLATYGMDGTKLSPAHQVARFVYQGEKKYDFAIG
jgi:hypothetical protein